MLANNRFGKTLGEQVSPERALQEQPAQQSLVGSSRSLRRMLMTNRRTLRISIFTVGLVALFLPVMASAQGGYDPYGRNRDYGRYDQRYVRDSIHRLDRLAKEFERDVDRALDRSRQDGTRREDRINNEARQFRDAVGDLKSRFGNGRDLNRSRSQAQRVIHEAQNLDRIAGSRRMNNEVANDWAQIRQELRIISDAYGLGYYGYGNGTYRRDDDWRRNDRNRNNDWWRRVPWPNN